MKVIATTLIKHNGNYYQIGQEIPGLTEDEIARLVASNSAKVKDGVVAPAAPDNALETPPDKTLETKGLEEVANLPISMNLSKEKLIGIARANGLKVEKTATRPEVYNMIKEYREKEGINVEDADPADKPKVDNPDAPNPEDVAAADVKDEGENAPQGEEGSDEGKDEGADEPTAPAPAKGKGKKK